VVGLGPAIQHIREGAAVIVDAIAAWLEMAPPGGRIERAEARVAARLAQRVPSARPPRVIAVPAMAAHRSLRERGKLGDAARSRQQWSEGCGCCVPKSCSLTATRRRPKRSSIGYRPSLMHSAGARFVLRPWISG